MANKKSKKGLHQIQQPKRDSHDEAYEQFLEACDAVREHPIFSGLFYYTRTHRHPKDNLCPADGWALVTNTGMIHVHPKRYGDKDEWIYVLTHCLLHLSFEHFRQRDHQPVWNAACDVYIARFLQDMRFGRPPEEMRLRVEGLPHDEESIYRLFLENGIPDNCKVYSVAGAGVSDMLLEPNAQMPRYHWNGLPIKWGELFGQGLANAVTGAVQYAAGETVSMERYSEQKRRPTQRAMRWFVSSYPLLGALATSFKLIEDIRLCQQLQITVAAVDAEAAEIYINPAVRLTDEECKFVIAHELLHVALRHHARRQGRDAYYWNVACDYVINQWLIEMAVGHIPAFGLLYDPTLKGMNAEAIYDLIVNDLRRFRKLATLRGFGLGDMLDSGEAEWWTKGDGLSLDDFYRRCLSQGLSYYQASGRGFLPAGLIEEIQAMNQPPIPWDVELAQWFDHYFAPLEKSRTYTRLSRRQSSTPDIPRPHWVPKLNTEDGRTYGVVLDTSGSMDSKLLAKALGTIASYSIARDVPAVRVVFCDAVPYDAGYMPPEDIAGRVRIKGRGGTILQPGIDLLERAVDFPKDAPILIITDGDCDRLRIWREHAFLMPKGQRLPFVPKGSVFRMSYIRVGAG